jgi:hypothetical protein
MVGTDFRAEDFTYRFGLDGKKSSQMSVSDGEVK